MPSNEAKVSPPHVARRSDLGAAPRSEEPPPALTNKSCFRVLLGDAKWSLLSPAVQRRFERELAEGERRIFVGQVLKTSHTRLGLVIARLAALIGSPLPDSLGAVGPATVVVTESAHHRGQIWTRIYPRNRGQPQAISSVKRFSGPTGLEEYLGYGLVMRLTLDVEKGALVFRSAGYALELSRLEVGLPRWLSPGDCTIMHRDLGQGRFLFTLELAHPWLGRLIAQEAELYELNVSQKPRESLRNEPM